MDRILSFLRKIKRKLPGFNYSSYVKDYLFRANVTSCIYLSVVVCILEIWMLFNIIIGAVFKDGHRSFIWIIQHTSSYIVLLVTAIIMLIYSIGYLNGKIRNQKLGYGIRFFFMIIALTFGIYISYISYDRSGQVFAFVTMEAFCLCLLVWHPVNHFIILTISFAIYLYLQNKLAPLSLSVKINSFTLWIVFLMCGINTHHQRRLEAEKDENLEKMTVYLKNKSLIDELTKLPNLDCFQRNVIDILAD